MLYFAYGSNMLTERLQNRVPSASPLSTAIVSGFTLRYHKKGRDGSAKCTLRRRDDSSVYGVIFEMDRREKNQLDKAEGLGNGYGGITISVEKSLKQFTAYTYIASESFIDKRLRPYSWYKQLVIAGARQHRLPGGYIGKMLDVQALEDPNKHRAEQYWNVIALSKII